MYRIYTENVNKAGIEHVLQSHFDGYTILNASGCWKKVSEASLVIELDSLSLDEVKTAAQEIKSLNKQDAVLVTYQPQTSVLV